MHRWDVVRQLRRVGADAVPRDGYAPPPADDPEWSWPPYAPVDESRFSAEEDWAPPSVVWHPQVRLGRWTVVYRRSA